MLHVIQKNVLNPDFYPEIFHKTAGCAYNALHPPYDPNMPNKPFVPPTNIKLPRVVTADARTALVVTNSKGHSTLFIWGEWRGRAPIHTPEEVILPQGHIITHMALQRCAMGMQGGGTADEPTQLFVATRSAQGSHLFIVDGLQPPREAMHNNQRFLPLNHTPTHLTVTHPTGHHFIATTDGEGQSHIFGWGDNHWAQLGVGDRTKRHYPAEITQQNGCPWLPRGHKVTHIAAGVENSFMATQGPAADEHVQADLWVWGCENRVCLGIGNATRPDQTRPHKMTQPNGNSWFPRGHKITHLVTGYGQGLQTLVATRDIQGNDHLWAWGRNEDGAMGLEDQDSCYKPTEVTQENGDPLVPPGHIITHLATEASGSAMITRDLQGHSHLWLWGWWLYVPLSRREHAQFAGRLSQPRKVAYTPFLARDIIISLSILGHEHTAITTLGTDGPHVYIWGSNDQHQLGIGITASNNESEQRLQPIHDLAQIYRGDF